MDSLLTNARVPTYTHTSGKCPAASKRDSCRPSCCITAWGTAEKVPTVSLPILHSTAPEHVCDNPVAMAVPPHCCGRAHELMEQLSRLLHQYDTLTNSVVTTPLRRPMAAPGGRAATRVPAARIRATNGHANNGTPANKAASMSSGSDSDSDSDAEGGDGAGGSSTPSDQPLDVGCALLERAADASGTLARMLDGDTEEAQYPFFKRLRPNWQVMQCIIVTPAWISSLIALC